MSTNTEPEIARDPGPLNENQAIIALDFHANKAAKRGDYGLHDDLKAVADLIERMSEQLSDLETEREQLQEISRRARAGVESLTRIP